MYQQVQDVDYHHDLVCSLPPLILPSSFILKQSPQALEPTSWVCGFTLRQPAFE